MCRALRPRLWNLLARLFSIGHRQNASGNNMSQR